MIGSWRAQVCLWRADLLYGVLHVDAENRIHVKGGESELDPQANVNLLLGLPRGALTPGAHLSSVLPPLVGRPTTIFFQIGCGGLDVSQLNKPEGHRLPAGLLKTTKGEPKTYELRDAALLPAGCCDLSRLCPAWRAADPLGRPFAARKVRDPGPIHTLRTLHFGDGTAMGIKLQVRLPILCDACALRGTCAHR